MLILDLKKMEFVRRMKDGFWDAGEFMDSQKDQAAK